VLICPAFIKPVVTKGNLVAHLGTGKTVFRRFDTVSSGLFGFVLEIHLNLPDCKFYFHLDVGQMLKASCSH